MTDAIIKVGGETIRVTVGDSLPSYQAALAAQSATDAAASALSAAAARDVAVAIDVDYPSLAAAQAGSVNGDFFTYRDASGNPIYATKTAGTVVILDGPWIDSDKIGVNGATLDKVLRYVTPQMHGAVGNAIADDTAALNAAGVECRLTGAALVSPELEPGAYYKTTGMVDFSDISHIDFGSAMIRGAGGAYAYVKVGSSTSSPLTDAFIKVSARNSDDSSSLAGNRGIQIGGLQNSKLWLFARGFNEGWYFDGKTNDTSWVGNDFHVVDLYNNNSHIHLDLDGGSYAVKDQIYGGSFYLGTGVKVSGHGLCKITLANGSVASEITFYDSQIGLDGASAHATYALVQADLNTTSNTNSVRFLNARFETYGAWTDPKNLIRFAGSVSGTLSISMEFDSTTVMDGRVLVPEQKNHMVEIISRANTLVGGNHISQTIIPPLGLPYQEGNNIRVPGKVLFDANYTAPASAIVSGVSSRQSRAGVDRRFISGNTEISFGHIYNKPVGTAVFLRLLTGNQQIAVVCYDSAGAILSGTDPYYAVGRNHRSVSKGTPAAGIYESQGNWVWIHPDVVSFFIGMAAWTGNGELDDVPFEVTYGYSGLIRDRRKETISSLIAVASPTSLYMPVGSSIDGTASNGWRNTFFKDTVTTAAQVSTDTQVTVSDSTGLVVGDTIGVELNTVIAGAEREYHNTTISGLPGAGVVQLTVALPAAVAIGRRVLFNRWVAR